MDEGRRLTDIELEKLEKALSREYRTAKKEMQKKLDKFQKKFAKSDKSQKGHLEKGDITEEQYINWKKGQLLRSSWMKDMINSYVDDQTNVNKKATSLINDVLPEVYAENHNFGTYQVEHEAKIGTSYTLFNKDTVVRLLKDDPKLLPTAKLDIPKDKRWNKQMMNSALVQGIMQGESADDIAKRLMNVTGMNESSAIRAARTMITGAEAAGKLDSYRRMKAMGIPVLKMWQATLDDKTRSSHRHLDRETADVDAPFSNGLMYPGDPDGIGVEVYNCRCNLSMQIKGFERDQSPENRMSKLGNMSYEEWKNYLNTPKHGAGGSGIEIDNDLSPIEKGEAMTWDKADAGSVNPDYGQEGTRTNCQTCVPVFIARLQGYDIEALPYTEKAEVLAKNVSSAYVNAERLLAPRLYDLLDGTNAEKFERMFALTDEGAILQVAFDWAGADEGHTAIMSTDEEGMFIYDPQDDSYAFEDEFEMYFSNSRVDLQSIEVYRVDNAEINWDVLRPFVRRRTR